MKGRNRYPPAVIRIVPLFWQGWRMIEEAAETGYPPAMIRIAWAKLLGTHTRLLHFLSQIKTFLKFFCTKKECCGSEMLILDPGSKFFYPGSCIKKIPDPVPLQRI
jgi:hypothetical protein